MKPNEVRHLPYVELGESVSEVFLEPVFVTDTWLVLNCRSPAVLLFVFQVGIQYFVAPNKLLPLQVDFPLEAVEMSLV